LVFIIIDQLSKLIHTFKVAPLVTIDRPQVTILLGEMLSSVLMRSINSFILRLPSSGEYIWQISPDLARFLAQPALVGPVIPDTYAILYQVANIGVTADKPQQLVENGLEMNLFTGYQRKALGQSQSASDSQTHSRVPVPVRSSLATPVIANMTH